jgi:hypothetical protein
MGQGAPEVCSNGELGRRRPGGDEQGGALGEAGDGARKTAGSRRSRSRRLTAAAPRPTFPLPSRREAAMNIRGGTLLVILVASAQRAGTIVLAGK